MIPFSENEVEEVFNSYPEHVRPTMLALRDLVYSTAQRLGISDQLHESLKWGEPSYLTKVGSTVRMHWKESDSEYFRVFFHCQTTLISTFREVYPSDFDFEGNRAIRFRVGDDIDLARLGHCIELSLRYHEVKHLPQLGSKADR
jgi:hypothetical protein